MHSIRARPIANGTGHKEYLMSYTRIYMHIQFYCFTHLTAMCQLLWLSKEHNWYLPQGVQFNTHCHHTSYNDYPAQCGNMWIHLFKDKSWGLGRPMQDSAKVSLAELLNGYGSIPINTIFSGMNIRLPAILMWTTGLQGFWPIPMVNWRPTCCRVGVLLRLEMYCSRCLLGSTWPIVARFGDVSDTSGSLGALVVHQENLWVQQIICIF